MTPINWRRSGNRASRLSLVVILARREHLLVAVGLQAANAGCWIAGAETEGINGPAEESQKRAAAEAARTQGALKRSRMAANLLPVFPF